MGQFLGKHAHPCQSLRLTCKLCTEKQLVCHDDVLLLPKANQKASCIRLHVLRRLLPCWGWQASGTLALMLLGSLVAAEAASAASASAVASHNTLVAEAICRTGLPDSMLQDLAACGPLLTQQVWLGISECKMRSFIQMAQSPGFLD